MEGEEGECLFPLTHPKKKMREMYVFSAHPEKEEKVDEDSDEQPKSRRVERICKVGHYPLTFHIIPAR